MTPTSQQQQERIRRSTAINAMTGCWEWTACTQSNGYGRMTTNRKVDHAHRQSYMAHVGDIPKGFEVCHTCDNPRCVNPCHLFIGDRRANARDAMAKGRLSQGDEHSQRIRRGTSARKISEEDARAIIEMRKQGVSCIEIARHFNCTPSNISKITNGSTWRWM